MLNVTFRPLNPETDYPALAQVYRTAEQAAGIEPLATAERLCIRTRGTRWVAEEPSRLDFFPAARRMAGQSPTRCFIYAVIHPAWRRQGLGRPDRSKLACTCRLKSILASRSCWAISGVKGM